MRQERKRAIDTWCKMKQLIRGQFLPPDYEHILYKQYLDYSQHFKSITEYAEEYFRLRAKVNMNESEV